MSEPVRSFTVGFQGDFVDNELEPARETAELLSFASRGRAVERRVFRVAAEVGLASRRADCYTSAFAFYKICELARQHVKVVLTGQGADEPFAGYPRYLGERYGGVYRRFHKFFAASILAPLLRSLPRNEQLKRAVRSLGIENEIERLAHIYTVLDEGLRHDLLLATRLRTTS